MPDAPRRKAHITSSFNDIGTGESYEAGATPLLDAGVFENYKAAGLISETAVTPAASPPSTPKKRKPSSKSRRKAAATSKTPTVPASPPASDPEVVEPGA